MICTDPQRHADVSGSAVLQHWQQKRQRQQQRSGARAN
jgi:hypothetical protein